MSHSDDKGLVLPPAIAPLHVVIVPFFKTQEDLTAIMLYLQPILDVLKDQVFVIENILGLKKYQTEINVEIDTNEEKSPGRKFNEYELKGIPVRLTVGKKEMEQ